MGTSTAWWGSPSWAVGQICNFDGRTRFARRYKVIVDTQGYETEVEQDWTGFRTTDAVRDLYEQHRTILARLRRIWLRKLSRRHQRMRWSQNRNELATLGQGARLEVAEFLKVIAQTHQRFHRIFWLRPLKLSYT